MGGWRRVGGPKGGGPKISRFFSSVPPLFSFFLLLHCVSCVFFGGVWKHQGRQILEFSGCREAPAAPKNHQNSTKRPPREEERMKIVAGEGKSEILGGPAKSGGGWSWMRGPAEGSRGERPNFGRTHENFEPTHHTTTHHNTTQHNTTTSHPHHNGGSRTGLGQGRSSQGSWPKKQNMSKSRPIGQGFWTQNGLIRKGVKRRSGPKVEMWSEKKHGKDNSKKKNVHLPFTQNKT